MKIIIYDDLVRVLDVKRGTVTLLVRDDPRPLSLKKGDVIGISHTVEISYWTLIKFLFIGQELIVNKPNGKAIEGR